MAQTGYTPILIYSSSTASNAPAAGSLTNSTLGSELAINITDGKLFYKDNANAVQVIGWKTTPTTAGGTGLTSYTAGDLLYYATGTTLSKLAIGTAYYMLGVNAGATAPSWQPSATSVLTTQGDLLYASAANTLARLAKNTTATRYLSNTGASNNPAWAQIDLTNGVTGTLPVGNGGTGITSLTTNQIPYGNNASAFQSSANLTFDGTTLAVTGYAKNSATISVGNATPSTSGAGVSFPATQSASSDANTLDDYEEGAWTPTLRASSSGTITMNGTYTSGKYTKIGRLVVCTASFYVDSVSSPTGNLYIDGLPFTVGAPSSAGAVWCVGLTSSANNMLVMRIDSGSTSVLVQAYASGTTSAAAPYVKAATEMNVTLTYFV